MAMKMIPFGCTLAGLTLKGEHRDVAQAHYELEGRALECRLAEINTSDKTELKVELLDIDLKHGVITEEDHDIKSAEATLQGDELEIELLVLQRKYKHITKEEYDYKFIELKYKDSEHETDLPFARFELDKKYGKLTEKEFDKAIYSLGGKPWVDVVESSYEEKDGSDGFMFELDWNEAFIQMLRSEGYNGATDDALVEQWFEDKALDNYLGVLAEQMEEIGEDPEDAHMVRRSGGQTVKEALQDKKTRHS